MRMKRTILLIACLLTVGCTPSGTTNNGTVDTGVTNTAPSTSPSASASPSGQTGNDSSMPPR